MKYMQLPWVFNIPKNELKCQINEDLWYIAHRGGVDGYTKFFQGDSIEISYEDWVDEKLWLSENFSDQLGRFLPLSEIEAVKLSDELKVETSKIPCFFGITEMGDYLDRNQRPGEVMSNSTHKLMAEVPTLGERLYDPDVQCIYETPDGKRLFKREFNTMPCCVFPDSPSWVEIDIDEFMEEYPELDIEEYLAQADLSTVDSELLEKYFIFN